MYECDRCDKEFGSVPAVRQHKDAVGHVWECSHCDQAFYDRQYLEYHQEDEGHDGPVFDCGKCSKRFGSWRAAKQHMDSQNHVWYCDHCQVGYYKHDDLQEHQYQEGHDGPVYECEGCNASFSKFAHAKSHMNQEGHWRKHWCSDCQKGFENENNLKAHLNSKIHRGSDIICPFCKHGFTTATGVAHHLETGSCPKARSVNRETILTEIRRRDPKGLITKKLLTGLPDAATTTASASSYNHGRGVYECYLCHKGFRELASLNKHVNSPAHKQKVYHCPGRACSKDFSALAALFNHLESESCGSVRFDAVQRNVGGFLGGKKLIAFA